MALPEIDPNAWYTLYVNDNNNSALMSTNLFSRSGTAGAAYFVDSAPDNSTQRWQMFPVGNATFVLRTEEGSSNAFLGTQPADNRGIISPLMLRGDVADDSVFWRFGAWGDGTQFMWNGGNGTDMHLAKNGTGIVMDANITAPRNDQRWKWDAGARIDNEAYSSLNLLGATLTSPATASAAATGFTSSTSFPAPNTPATGLSTGGKAGTGAAVGIAALIALVVLGRFVRRRRQNRTPKPHASAYEPYHGQGGGEVAPALPQRREELMKHELGGGSAKYEMLAPTVTEGEARGQGRPMELEGDGVRR